MQYEHTSGKLIAQGPGWLSTVRPQRTKKKSEGGGASFPEPPTPGASSSPGTPPAVPKLSYVRVTFQDRIDGNLRQEDVRLKSNVHVVYGPVTRWEDTIPDADYRRAASRSIEVHCAELRAARLTRNGLSGLALNATGNTRILGHLFEATAERLSYDQLKDLVVLEGNPRSGVALRYAAKPGSEPITMNAERIRLWPTTMDIQTDGFRGAQVRPGR